VKTKDGIYQEMRELSLRPGMKLFLNDVEVTKEKGFGLFNLVGKWKKTYRGFTTKEPWYILTNFGELETAILAYQKRFCIEEIFRDFKSGSYNLEGSRLDPEYLSKLIIVDAPDDFFIEQGRQQEILESIELGLELKFGAKGLELLPEIRQIQDLDILKQIRSSLRTVESIEQLRQLYTE
jgi:hypothetical protein